MSFSDEDILAVWKKGSIDPQFDSNKIRKDVCDAWLRYSEYGDRNSIYGWEVDHIDPNGGDNLKNLRPLQWNNNVAKSDARGGSWRCAVKSNGDTNVKL